MKVQTRLLPQNNNDPKPPKKPDQPGKGIIGQNPVTDTLFLGSASYTLGTAYPSTWLHEMGHAKMAEALFVDPQTSIEVNPFRGGVMRWRPGQLSELGHKVGRDTARGMVAAAGPVVDMAIAATSFGVGFKMRKEHPLIGRALMGYGIMSVVNDIAYAGKALGGDMVKKAAAGNDFANMGVKLGLHPIASIAIMASIIPLEYLALKYLEDRGADQQ